MPNIFKPKRSSTASSVPTTGNLSDGEMAVNLADRKVYVRNGASIVTVADSLVDGDKGDITVSSSGATWTIDSGVVTNAKLANVSTATIKGRTTAGSGSPEDLTGTQATALLDAFTSSLKGLAPASGGGTSNFLRADGTWAAPTFTVSGNLNVGIVTATSFVRSGGTSTQFLKADGSVDTNTYITSASVGNGTLSLGVSGTGLSGTASFTANQSGNTTFTVTSNATSANTPNAIVSRDGSGNFIAGIVTATTFSGALSGNATSATTATSATSAGSVTNSVTFNNGGAGAASGTTFNGSAAQTISHNTIGASPLAGSTSLTTTGTVTTGTWSGSFGAVSGANLTSLTAGNLSGTIPSAVLGNSSLFVGTTSIALNRASASQSLTGVNIDGSSGSCTGNANTATTLQTLRTIWGQNFNGSQSVTGALSSVTTITFTAEASDAASIGPTITSNQTAFDFNLADDNNNDLWRWRFTPSGSTVYNAMTLTPTANGVSNLAVAGSITATSFSGSLANTLTAGSYLTGTSYNNSSAVTFAVDATTAATASKVVARDASGNIFANQVVGGTGSGISAAGLVVNGTTGDNDSQLIIKKPSQSAFGVLTWDGQIYLSANVYYENGSWIHSAPTGNTNNNMLTFVPGTGVTWYASNNSSGSWNVSSALTLWNDSGVWQRPVSNSITFNNGGAGGASGSTFNNSAALTVSYNTVGAPSTTGTNASGSWGISITGSSASCTGAAASNVLKAGDTMTGQLISTLANNTATGGGQIYLNGATGNRIDFNQNGVAAPTFTTRSAGAKLVLYPAISASSADYALGIENSTLWSSVPTTSDQFKWYAGTTNVATLTGAGNFSATGSITGNTIVKSGGTSSQFLKADGSVDSSTYALSTHTHGNITNGGAIGSTANLPIITTTSGVLTTGSFGTAANTFCQGNDSRLSDTRNTTNSITFNNGGAGGASASTFNGSSALTVSYNTIGASPLAGSTSLTTTGTVTSGTWSGLFGAVSGANLTSLTAGNLSGTIPSAVLGNSSVFIGTTSIALNRASATQSLTGVNIDGSSGSCTGNSSTASNLSASATTLATATESNAITISAPSYTTDQPVKLLNFDWYSNIFSLGNIRSGSTASNGFGVYYTASGGSRTEIARFGTGGTFNTIGAITQNGSQVLTAGNYTTYAAASNHTHGNITNGGAIGSVANLPIITTTSGLLTTGSFGTAANTFCQGNDSRLSDTRNTTNSITFNNGGTGDASGTTFNGSTARTISHNTIGASPAAGSSSLITTGNVTTGTWSGLFGAVSGANLTSLTAGNLSGTIPSAVLGNSTLFIGTTSIALNRASASQSLTGIIDITASGNIAVDGAFRAESSDSTQRFDIYYNETTDSLDFDYLTV
jgi:hypothetical protein